MTGSHIDTVSTAGKYDGVLGVLAGLEGRTLKGFSQESSWRSLCLMMKKTPMRGSIGYTKDKPDIKASWKFMWNRVQFWMFNNWTLVW